MFGLFGCGKGCLNDARVTELFQFFTVQEVGFFGTNSGYLYVLVVQWELDCVWAFEVLAGSFGLSYGRIE